MNTTTFWNVIGAYNQATVLIQCVLFILLFASVIFAWNGKWITAPKLVLGICNLFIGIAFELKFGMEPIQKYFAAPLFILIGILFLYEGIRHSKDNFQKLGKTEIFLLALTLCYPLISYLLGHAFPKMVLYIMPCPLICFSLLIYSGYQRKNKLLLLLMTIWGMTGIKSLFFQVMEDTILFILGIYGIYLIWKELRKDRSPKRHNTNSNRK